LDRNTSTSGERVTLQGNLKLTSNEEAVTGKVKLPVFIARFYNGACLHFASVIESLNKVSTDFPDSQASVFRRSELVSRPEQVTADDSRVSLLMLDAPNFGSMSD
jgi:hypothetical protein